MAKCKNCRNIIPCVNPDGTEFAWCDIKDDTPDLEINRECALYEAMTNADRIRAMSDKELAEYIFGVSIGNAPCVLCSEECDFCELSDEDCKKKTLDWLQSEAE